jgi:hypothetical protein
MDMIRREAAEFAVPNKDIHGVDSGGCVTSYWCSQVFVPLSVRWVLCNRYTAPVLNADSCGETAVLRVLRFC